MKKLLLSLLCVGFVHGAFGAAGSADDSNSRCDQSLISVSLLNDFDADYAAEKKCFEDGITASIDFTDEDKKNYLKTGFFGSIASIQYDKKVVGVIVYSSLGEVSHPRIDWIVIDPGYQSKGIGKHAIDLFAHTLNATKISLKPASQRLQVVYMEKWGFQKKEGSCDLTKNFS